MPHLARDLMQVSVLTVPAMQPLLEALDLFVKSGVSGALVVDDSGAILGQLRTRELLQVLDQALDDDLDAGESGDVSTDLSSLVARDVATNDVVWVAPDANVGELVAMLRRPGVDRLVVGEGGVPAGIITAFELLAALDDR